MNIEPIGVIRTCFGSKFAVPRQPGLCPSAWGVLEFSAKYRSAEAVRGLEGFSHVWLVFGFHLTTEDGWHPTVRPPKLGGNRRVGVFASRSTFRPNGLGLSLVTLDAVEMSSGNGACAPYLRLSGVDLVDGTPIYDVKPYLPFVESIPEARCGFVVDPPPRLSVVVEDQAVSEFARLDGRDQQVIREVLSLDPRPAIHPEDGDRMYGALLCGRNIRFHLDPTTCWISAIDAIV